jgi:hypothetical protein
LSPAARAATLNASRSGRSLTGRSRSSLGAEPPVGEIAH